MNSFHQPISWWAVHLWIFVNNCKSIYFYSELLVIFIIKIKKSFFVYIHLDENAFNKIENDKS